MTLHFKDNIEDKVTEQATSDFWYDFFEGGYIKPENYLIEEDAKKVEEARKLLIGFREIIEANELIGEM